MTDRYRLAYKVVAVEPDGRLTSAFRNAYRPQYCYQPWCWYQARPVGQRFLSFKTFEHALWICRHTNDWNLRNVSLLVLPVRVEQNLVEDRMLADNSDSQCMDLYLDTIQSDRIMVLDGSEARSRYRLAMAQYFVERQFLGLRRQQASLYREVLQHLCPQLLGDK